MQIQWRKIAIPAALPLLLAACAKDPIDFIPPSELAMLEYEELDQRTGSTQGIPVDVMLARARGEDPDDADKDDADADAPEAPASPLSVDQLLARVRQVDDYQRAQEEKQ